MSEEEGMKFAETINALFCYTSAKSNSGIDQLFYKLGLKYLSNLPEFKKLTEKKNDSLIDINAIKEPKKKKKCC